MFLPPSSFLFISYNLKTGQHASQPANSTIFFIDVHHSRDPLYRAKATTAAAPAMSAPTLLLLAALPEVVAGALLAEEAAAEVWEAAELKAAEAEDTAEDTAEEAALDVDAPVDMEPVADDALEATLEATLDEDDSGAADEEPELDAARTQISLVIGMTSISSLEMWRLLEVWGSSEISLTQSVSAGAGLENAGSGSSGDSVLCGTALASVVCNTAVVGRGSISEAGKGTRRQLGKLVRDFEDFRVSIGLLMEDKS